MEQTIQIDFYDDKITVLVENGEPFIAIRPVAESFGLVWAGQLRAIKKDEVLSSTVYRKYTVDSADGRRRKMIFLPLEFFHGWLFKINPAKCRSDRREKIIEYQRECYRVLNEYFSRGGAVNPEASESQLLGLQGRIDYYLQFTPKEARGTSSAVSGRERVLLVRSYFRAHPRQGAEMHPDLFEFFRQDENKTESVEK